MEKMERRGGSNSERLYLEDDEFKLPDDTHVVISRTDLPGVNMNDLKARHLARYGIVSLFCRPGYKILDFPCGSGYAASLLEPFDIDYLGMDFDPVTVEYARRKYGKPGINFEVGDLNKPELPKNQFCIISCIEGLEHIPAKSQFNLIRRLKAALRPGGVLVVSSPENPTGFSGKSVHNPHHLWELTRTDFIKLLHTYFPPDKIELITTKESISTKVFTTCFYAVCHK